MTVWNRVTDPKWWYLVSILTEVEILHKQTEQLYTVRTVIHKGVTLLFQWTETQGKDRVWHKFLWRFRLKVSSLYSAEKVWNSRLIMHSKCGCYSTVFQGRRVVLYGWDKFGLLSWIASDLHNYVAVYLIYSVRCSDAQVMMGSAIWCGSGSRQRNDQWNTHT